MQMWASTCGGGGRGSAMPIPGGGGWKPIPGGPMPGGGRRPIPGGPIPGGPIPGGPMCGGPICGANLSTNNKRSHQSAGRRPSHRQQTDMRHAARVTYTAGRSAGQRWPHLGALARNAAISNHALFYRLMHDATCTVTTQQRWHIEEHRGAPPLRSEQTQPMPFHCRCRSHPNGAARPRHGSEGAALNSPCSVEWVFTVASASAAEAELRRAEAAAAAEAHRRHASASAR